MANVILKQLAEQTGMVYHKNSGVVCGSYQGHMICVSQSAGNLPLAICASVKESSSTPAMIFENFAPAFKTQYKNVQSVARTGNKITIIVGYSFQWRTTLQRVKEALDGFAAFLAGGFYTDCCEGCGSEYGLGAYAINGGSSMYCDSCYQNALSALEGNKQQIKQKKGNLVTGIVGALIGSLIGVVVWVLIGQLGYISVISGLIMGVCALKGYELLGGKINVAGVIVSCVISILMILLAENINMGIAIATTLKANFFDAFRSVPAFLGGSSDLMGAFAKDLAFGYITFAVICVPTIIGMFKQKSGHYQVTKLT